MESKERWKPPDKIETDKCREQIDGCYRGGGLGNWVKKVKGVRRDNVYLVLTMT